MKKSIVTLMTVAAIFMANVLTAQTAIDGLYKKYAGQEGFTSINISPEMYGLISGFDMNDSSESAQEVQSVVEQLSGLKMLVYEPKKGQTNEAFLDEIRTLSKVKGYTEMMSVDSEDEVVKFLAKKGEDGRISEMLMIVLDGSEAVVMSMTGSLDMKSISQISSSLDIEIPEDVEEIEE
jgi:hypothetical protein